MKKTSIILTSILCSSFVFGLASCGDGGEGGREDPTIYKISYDKNANYEIINLASQGQEGSNILFDVESKSVFYEIGEVTYNGTSINKGSLGYEFIMPGKDVKIEVELTSITEYDDPDDYLSWGRNVIDEISMASEEDKGYEFLDCDQELTLNFNMTEFGSYNNVVETDEVLDAALVEISKEKILGFDTETRPNFTKGKNYPVSILQFGGEKKVWIIRLESLKERLADIYKILENPSIKKAGIAVQGDIKSLRARCHFNPAGFVDVSDYTSNLGVINTGMRNLTALITTH